MESQNVRKLFLVDQFDRVYKELQRPIQAVAKTKSSINLGRTLQDEHLSEDEKVRRYIGELHRYLHLRDARPQQQQQQQQQRLRRKKLPPSVTTERPPTFAVTATTALPSPRRLRPSPRKLHSTSTPRVDAADVEDDEVFFATAAAKPAPAAAAAAAAAPAKKKQKTTSVGSDDWSKYRRGK